MSQHGYMRHMTTPPLVLEIGQKLCQYCPILTTSVCLSHGLSHACIVTKRKKYLSRFLYHTKNNLA